MISRSVGIVVEWLLAHAIARQHQAPPLAVPNGDGEHASQPGEAVVAIFFIEMDDSFGIRPGREPVPSRLQIAG